MQKIYALTDYKNYFGSKWNSIPYRSGFDKELLKSYFYNNNFEIEFIRFQDINFKNNWRDKLVIYTSSEDTGLNYKSYIEDIVLGIEKEGAFLLPRFEFLRANNNKVYMEIIKERVLDNEFSSNLSLLYGTLEEMYYDIERNKIKFPCVIKKASGAMSRGVFLARNKNELNRYVKRISRTPHYLLEMKDIIRSFKYEGYK
jgi:hypothetical protein